MTTRLYDAHVHLAEVRLRRYLKEIQACYDAINLNRAVVVGTNPHDWDAVLEQCAADARFLPAIGLHPWHVSKAPADWKASFLKAFDNGARAVGEIGLDRWIEGHDLAAQIPVFKFQLCFAAERNLPVSIHVLKATDPMMDILRVSPLPARGFHLHAYNGSVELIPELTHLGAYFSINAGQLKNDAAIQSLRAIPQDRLLIETDAPDFLPPEQHRKYKLPDPMLNHPANLKYGYQAVASILGIQPATLAEAIESNFKAFFLEPN